MKKLNSLVMKTNRGEDHNVFQRNGKHSTLGKKRKFSLKFIKNVALISCRICDGDPDCVDGADENVTLHHCATPQPCGEDMFTCENGRCVNKVSKLLLK